MQASHRSRGARRARAGSSAPTGRTNRPNCCAEKAKHTSSHIRALRRLGEDDIVAFERGEKASRPTVRPSKRRSLRCGAASARFTRQRSSTAIPRARRFSAARRTPVRSRQLRYEVVDTKLGLRARPYYLVQICNYSEHLARLQCTMPELDTSCSETARNGAFACTIISRTIADSRRRSWRSPALPPPARSQKHANIRRTQALLALRVERRV